MRDAIIGALFVAAVSTLGDFIWAMWIPRHRAIYGLTHGTLLFLAVGWYLGSVKKRPASGALGGALVGFLAAGSFYVIAPVVGYSAMFASYFGVWIGLAVFVKWLSRLRREDTVAGLRRGRPVAGGDTAEVLTRGIAAAIGSGIAFYAVSGIWFPFRPRGWDYAIHFVSWTIAYLPGFLALLVHYRGASGAGREQSTV